LGTKKGAELQKREQQLLCAASIIAAVATRKWNRNGHISKRKKNSSKHTVKKRISTVRVMRHLSYMLKINMTLQKIS
jgi:hypothetical protein